MLSIVINLAPINWAKAVDCARMIYDPVPACCAFACCGRFAPYPHSVQLIDIAFQKAQAHDGFQGHLTSSSISEWIKALPRLRTLWMNSKKPR